MAEPSPLQSRPTPEATLERVREVIRRERRTLVDEQQAFESFADRLREMPAREPDDRTRPPLSHQGTAGVRQVREAYAATVMSVPHYREEYGESLYRSLASEFSEELAAAVTSGTHLYPHLKTSLLEAAREAATQREAVIDMLDEEAAAVERATDRTAELLAVLEALLDQPLDRAGFNTLRRTRERLVALRGRCDAAVAERQDALQSHTRSRLVDVEDFGRYLYADGETVHPILSELATLRTAIDRAIARTDRLLADAN